MSSKRFALALAAASLVSFGASAQQATGNIQGVAVTGDTVQILQSDIGFKREIKIEKDGKYMFRRVPTGTYAVTVTHAEGTTVKPQGVVVQVGTTARVK